MSPPVTFSCLGAAHGCLQPGAQVTREPATDGVGGLPAQERFLRACCPAHLKKKKNGNFYKLTSGMFIHSLPAFSHPSVFWLGQPHLDGQILDTHYSTYEHSYKQLKQNEKYICTFNSSQAIEWRPPEE